MTRPPIARLVLHRARPLATLTLLAILAACHGPGAPSDASKFPVLGHTYATVSNPAAVLPELTLPVGEARLLYRRRGIGPGSFFEPVVIAGGDTLRIEQRDTGSFHDFFLVGLVPGAARVQWRDWMHQADLSVFTVTVIGDPGPHLHSGFTALQPPVYLALDLAVVTAGARAHPPGNDGWMVSTYVPAEPRAVRKFPGHGWSVPLQPEGGLPRLLAWLPPAPGQGPLGWLVYDAGEVGTADKFHVIRGALIDTGNPRGRPIADVRLRVTRLTGGTEAPDSLSFLEWDGPRHALREWLDGEPLPPLVLPATCTELMTGIHCFKPVPAPLADVTSLAYATGYFTDTWQALCAELDGPKPATPSD